jgi:hypothetical protein
MDLISTDLATWHILLFIYIDLREMKLGDMDWIDLAKDIGTCGQGSESSISIKCWEIQEGLSLMSQFC